MLYNVDNERQQRRRLGIAASETADNTSEFFDDEELRVKFTVAENERARAFGNFSLITASCAAIMRLLHSDRNLRKWLVCTSTAEAHARAHTRTCICEKLAIVEVCAEIKCENSHDARLSGGMSESNVITVEIRSRS